MIKKVTPVYEAIVKVKEMRSASVVYNNFPWCNPTKEQKETIEDAAHGILDASAVMAAYGFNTKMTESECVAKLFKLYEELTKKSN